jgi:hypothetical protein
MILQENDLEFDFTGAVSAVKFDDGTHDWRVQNRLNVHSITQTANHIQKQRNNCHFNQNHSFLYSFSSFNTTNLLLVIFPKNLTTQVFSIEKNIDIVITRIN